MQTYKVKDLIVLYNNGIKILTRHLKKYNALIIGKKTHKNQNAWERLSFYLQITKLRQIEIIG
jgi:hypothetical protein